MNVIQQFEEEYQDFLNSIKSTGKRAGKVSAYHAAPSTLLSKAGQKRAIHKNRRPKRKLSLPTLSSAPSKQSTYAPSPKRTSTNHNRTELHHLLHKTNEEKLPEKTEEGGHISLAELETKRLSLPFLETIQYVHLALERRGIHDTGITDAKTAAKDAIKIQEEEEMDDDDDILFGIQSKQTTLEKQRISIDFDQMYGNAPAFDEDTLRKRYPIFSDQLDVQPRIVGKRRQATWLLQLIEEIYDARYMFEVDELSVYDKTLTTNKNYIDRNKKAVDMSKSIRRMHRRGTNKKSALDEYAEFLNLPSSKTKIKNKMVQDKDNFVVKDETSKEPPLSFPMFTYMFLSQLFGLKILVQQTAWDILYNLEALKEKYPELMAFSLYLREIRDIDTALFFLHCRHCLQEKYSIQFKLKEKIIPHLQKLKSVVTVDESNIGKIALYDHPELYQIRHKEVFLTYLGTLIWHDILVHYFSNNSHFV
jgi:hypothetical protein